MTLFSIIIPTRNRASTLTHAMDSVLRQTSDRFELVVSDNMSADDTRDVVLSKNSDRVRYISPGRPLSMRDHWEFTLDHIGGEYALILGDDDGLLPRAVETCSRLVARKPHAIINLNPAIYFWKNYPDQTKNNSVLYSIKSDMEIPSSMVAGEFVEDKYPVRFTPSIYYSFVRRDLINSIRKKAGRYFIGANPDFSSAMTNLLASDTFFSTGYPLMISGSSSSSTGLKFTKSSAATQSAILKDLDIGFPEEIDVPGMRAYMPAPFLVAETRILVIRQLLGAEAGRPLITRALVNAMRQCFTDTSIPVDMRAETLRIVREVSSKNGMDFVAFPEFATAAPAPAAASKNNMKFYWDIKQASFSVGLEPFGAETVADAAAFLHNILPPAAL